MIQHRPDSSHRLTPDRASNFDLGLPAHYRHDLDRKYIPTPDDLRRASVRALDDLAAFLLLHGDDPGAVLDHLDLFAGMIRAACQVSGDHVRKAIRLGLALDLRYWAYASRLDDWIELAVPLMAAASALHDSALQSELYWNWSIHLFLTCNQAEAEMALQKSLEYAADASALYGGSRTGVPRVACRPFAEALDEVRAAAATLRAADGAFKRPGAH